MNKHHAFAETEVLRVYRRLVDFVVDMEPATELYGIPHELSPAAIVSFLGRCDAEDGPTRRD